MANLTIRINVQEFLNNLEEYKERVLAEIQSDWDSVLARCIEDVLTRTPSPAQEYASIMYGGNPGMSIEDTSGKTGTTVFYKHSPRYSKRGSVEGDDRTRFLRMPGMWLEELVQMPFVYDNRPEAFYLGLGKIDALESGSKYSWINHAKSHGAHQHTSEFGVWYWFEYGLAMEVKPKFGGNYPLSPAEGAKVWAMVKSYPAKRMFSNINPMVFRDAIAEIVNRVQF